MKEERKYERLKNNPERKPTSNIKQTEERKEGKIEGARVRRKEIQNDLEKTRKDKQRKDEQMEKVRLKQEINQTSKNTKTNWWKEEQKKKVRIKQEIKQTRINKHWRNNKRLKKGLCNVRKKGQTTTKERNK